MNEKPKRRPGRPPNDPTSGTGRASFHVGLRLSDDKRDAVLRLVAEANERAREARTLGPPTTPSSMIHAWILEAIAREIAKSDGAAKRKR